MADLVKTNQDRILDVTLTLDTASAYAQNDVLAATQEIVGAVPNGSSAILTSIRLVDYAKNNAALQLWFMDSAAVIGTENAAENTADSISSAVLTVVDFAATDYTSEANWSRAVKKLGDDGMGVMLVPSQTPGTTRDTSLYIGAKITDATGKTYGAGDIRLKIGLVVG